MAPIGMVVSLSFSPVPRETASVVSGGPVRGRNLWLPDSVLADQWAKTFSCANKVLIMRRNCSELSRHHLIYPLR
jgi:hypothetical protein